MSPQKTLLQESLELGNLRLAWDEIAENKGISGVDDVSIRVWRRNWEERLVNLARDVRANRYKPKRLRLRRIPKRNRREWRTLRIPTVTDRVLQRAVMQVLQPIYEELFLDCSFGYRPRRGLKNAVERILVLRENGFQWVLDADIDEFFDNVDHALLVQFLRTDLPDDSLLRLIGLWLQVSRSKPDKAVGISMGSPLSPLLANLFLHRLDKALLEREHPVVRYADDFIVCAVSSVRARRVYAEVGAALEVLKLRYEPSKTQITSFEAGFEFLGVHFEGSTYRYTWEDKEIEISGDEVDWLFGHYGPDYE